MATYGAVLEERVLGERLGRGFLPRRPVRPARGSTNRRLMCERFQNCLSTCGRNWEKRSSCCTIFTNGSRPTRRFTYGKRLEEYRPFFIEDPLAPEQIGYFKHIRNQCATPLAMGELFNSLSRVFGAGDRAADRLHAGAYLANRRADAGAEAGGVGVNGSECGRPGTVREMFRRSGTAPTLRWTWLVTISEFKRATTFPRKRRRFSRGCPRLENGYFWANEAPGWGVDVNEELAAKYTPDRLPTPFDYNWGETRRRDGSVIRP